jgi:hypothetical protein
MLLFLFGFAGARGRPVNPETTRAVYRKKTGPRGSARPTLGGGPGRARC